MYVRMCDYVCPYVCTFAALTEGTAAFILSGKEDRVQRSMREEQNVFEAPKDHIILIKLIDTSMQLNFTLNNISQFDLILHYMI